MSSGIVNLQSAYVSIVGALSFLGHTRLPRAVCHSCDRQELGSVASNAEDSISVRWLTSMHATRAFPSLLTNEILRPIHRLRPSGMQGAGALTKGLAIDESRTAIDVDIGLDRPGFDSFQTTATCTYPRFDERRYDQAIFLKVRRSCSREPTTGCRLQPRD